MTETDWLACADPETMLRFLLGKTSNRKLRLFACACFRSHSLNGPSDKIVTIGELQADGLASQAEVQDAQIQALRQGAYQSVWVVVSSNLSRTMLPVFTHEFWLWRERLENDIHLLHDVFGNPFRPAIIDPSVFHWNGGTVVKIAQGIYGDRAFDRLPILADALEEAACTDSDILVHCRQPGPHVRGCWVIDTLLGKE